MKKAKHTKENPCICINYYERGPRRVCSWQENGKTKTEYFSRWLWKKERGPIPPGYFVHHKDKNMLNDKLENYEIIKAGEHSRLHISKNLCDSASLNRTLKTHDRLDNANKDKQKYISRWQKIEGDIPIEKLNNVLYKHGIKNLQQLSELTGIDNGLLSKIKKNTRNLGYMNIKRLFDSLDKMDNNNLFDI
jgi:hypothetical protein